ncbi:MAG TPA: UvrD-helicase domain-containing protein [Gemmatimonadales bacterium]|nr:UvrD-helicase domain-containing protein [Gemmatimonadales bacterium]
MTGATGHPPDQAARERIRTDLDTNLLVEAGAGSGKTTSLVERLVALVERGLPLESIAAVTFTRKAAAELRERFQLKLEAAGHLDALRDLDRAFLGTIHAFAGRLLREHPLEAGLDPTFEEVDQAAWPALCDGFWERWLEQLRLAEDAELRALDELGLPPRKLLPAFKEIVAHPDAEFPLVETPRPDHAPVRRRLEQLLDWASGLMPAQEPEAGYDALQEKVRLLRFLQVTTDWDETRSFCDALEQFASGKVKATYNRWVAGRKKDDLAPIKELEEAWNDFAETQAASLLERWREHRYPPLVRFLRRGARQFAAERWRHGTLGFEDLLTGAVRLLRERPEVRRRLGERWRRLLVDEFQDTDPIQAELCFLLASPPEEGEDWRTVRPRAGALFVVGDPKQSIYRFRRADIQTYEQVRERMDLVGAVLQLPASFRARPAVADLVNAHFRSVFPETASETQAAFAPLQPQRPPEPGDGVFRYLVTPEQENAEGILAADAAAVAAWVAAEVTEGRAPEDFLVLTRGRRGVAEIARALSQWQVPVDTTNAELQQESELRELVLLLRALADPTDPVLVTAALEGLFFGCTPADLWEARRAKVRFTLLEVPPESGPEPVRGALAQLVHWRRLADAAPADVLLERILDDTGLLALAASEPLGEGRAGVLVHLVEQLRSGEGGEALDLAAALERVESALKAEGLDVPLRPGRGGAVRVMNLHQAKGLEAHTVILAAPLKPTEHEPTLHVSRMADGPAQAWCVLKDDQRTLAQPPEWARYAAREEEFKRAEEARLLYVASTRAAQRLVIGRAKRSLTASGTTRANDGSPWAAFDEVTARCAELAIPDASPPGRPLLDADAKALRTRAGEVAEQVAGLATPTLAIRTVTERVKVEPPTESWREAREEERAYDIPDGRPRGAAWGRAVHRAIEGLGRGRRDEALARYVRAVVADELPWEAPEVQAARVHELLALCDRVRSSPEWASLGGDARVELPVYRLTSEGGRVIVEEGVIDAVGRADGGWRVVDWKTDAAQWDARVPQYQAQVDAYAEALQALTDTPATGRLVRLVE